MFYPVDSLRRGGRFHYCWIADSWPRRFAFMTNRQLKSQNIVEMCDDLLQVVRDESGRPSHRFSLRLSSQLLRGLTRVYERKTSIFLGELCMLNATILKLSNHRFDTPEKKQRKQLNKERKAPKALISADQFAEHQLLSQDNVQELLQNSGNVIANIAEITLLEVPPYAIAKPVTDGFGNEDEQMQSLFLGLEGMRQAQDKSSVLGDISNIEASKLQVSIEAPAQVEHASMEEQANVTMAPDNRSLPTITEIQVHLVADIRDVSKILEEEDAEKRGRRKILEEEDAELRVAWIELTQECQQHSNSIPELVHSTPLLANDKPVKQARKLSFGVPVAEIFADETLHLQPITPVLKRRRRTSKLKVDTQIALASSYMQSRPVPHIVNQFQDVPIQIDCVLPPERYFKRPAHSFTSRRQLSFSSHSIRNFQRNLFAIEKKPFEHREREFILAGAEADKRLAQETSIDKANTSTMARILPLLSRKRAHSFMLPKEGPEAQLEPLVELGNLPMQVLDGDQEIIEEEFQDVPIQIDCVLPPERYFKRPAHSFTSRRQLSLSSHYISHFQRNLFAIEKKPFEHREREFILAGAEADKRLAQETSIDKANTSTMARILPLLSRKRAHSFMLPKEGPEAQLEPLVELGNLPMQVLDGDQEIIEEEAMAPACRVTKSQTIKFRAVRDKTEGLVYEMETMRPPKIARLNLEDKAVEEHHPQETTSTIADVHQKSLHIEASSPPVDDSHKRSSLKTSQTVNELLLKAGLADKSRIRVERSDTDSTETPLGSLDRTAVSLGESVVTTDSRRFLREQWGSEATLLKIIKEINNSSRPLTFSRLLECGPQQTCNPRMVATACFTSLLKLKQANFIKVLKEDNSTDIKFIKLGAVLYEEEFL